MRNYVASLAWKPISITHFKCTDTVPENVSIAFERAYAVLKAKKKSEEWTSEEWDAAIKHPQYPEGGIPKPSSRPVEEKKLTRAGKIREKFAAERAAEQRAAQEALASMRGERTLRGQRSAISDDLRTTTDDARAAHREGSMGGKVANDVEGKMDFIRQEGVQSHFSDDDAYKQAVHFAFNASIRDGQFHTSGDSKDWNLPTSIDKDEGGKESIITKYGARTIHPEDGPKEAYYALSGTSQRKNWDSMLSRWGRETGFGTKHDSDAEVIRELAMGNMGTMSRAAMGGSQKYRSVKEERDEDEEEGEHDHVDNKAQYEDAEGQGLTVQRQGRGVQKTREQAHELRTNHIAERIDQNGKINQLSENGFVPFPDGKGGMLAIPQGFLHILSAGDSPDPTVSSLRAHHLNEIRRATRDYLGNDISSLDELLRRENDPDNQHLFRYILSNVAPLRPIASHMGEDECMDCGGHDVNAPNDHPLHASALRVRNIAGRRRVFDPPTKCEECGSKNLKTLKGTSYATKYACKKCGHAWMNQRDFLNTEDGELGGLGPKLPIKRGKGIQKLRASVHDVLNHGNSLIHAHEATHTGGLMGNHRSNSAGVDPETGELTHAAQTFSDNMEGLNPDLAAERGIRRSPGAGTETQDNPDALPSRCTMCAGSGHVTMQDALKYGYKVGFQPPQGHSGEDIVNGLEDTGALHSDTPLTEQGRVKINHALLQGNKEVRNRLASIFGIAPFPFNSMEDFVEHHGYDLDEALDRRKVSHRTKKDTLGHSFNTEYGVTCPHCHGVGVCPTCSGNKRDDTDPQIREEGVRAAGLMDAAMTAMGLQRDRPATSFIEHSSLEEEGAIPSMPLDSQTYRSAQKNARDLSRGIESARDELKSIARTYGLPENIDETQIMDQLRRRGIAIDRRDMDDANAHMKKIVDSKTGLKNLAPALSVMRAPKQVEGARPLLSSQEPLRVPYTRSPEEAQREKSEILSEMSAINQQQVQLNATPSENRDQQWMESMQQLQQQSQQLRERHQSISREGGMAFQPYTTEESQRMRAQMPAPQHGAVRSAAPQPVFSPRPAGEIPEGLEGASGWDLQEQLDTQGLGQTIEGQEAQRANLRDLAIGMGRRHWGAPEPDAPQSDLPDMSGELHDLNQQIRQLEQRDIALAPSGERLQTLASGGPYQPQPPSGLSDALASLREKRRQLLSGSRSVGVLPSTMREIFDPKEAEVLGREKGDVVPANLLPGGQLEPFDPRRDIKVSRETPSGGRLTSLPRVPTQLERLRGTRPPTRPIGSPSGRAMRAVENLFAQQRREQSGKDMIERRKEEVKRHQAKVESDAEGREQKKERRKLTARKRDPATKEKMARFRQEWLERQSRKS